MKAAGRTPRGVRAVVVALFVVAAGGCTGQEAQGTTAGVATAATTTASPGEALTVAPSRFEVRYRLDATTAASAAVGVDVPFGTVFRPKAAEGRVRAGDVVGALEMRSGWAAVEEGTVEQSRAAAVSSRLGPVRAPVSGILRASSSSVQVAKPGLDVVIALRPLQELRYRGMSFTGSASVETVLGQRQVRCEAVWIAPRGGTEVVGAESESSSTSQAHCRLPDNVETAPGLPAVLTLTSQALPDVIAIPAIYVGLDATGSNYVARVESGGTVVERPIVVGATDGVRRVVVSGLKPGDRVLPVPVS